jgi:c-di-GMP-binding flagellar brake protein YcgR
MTSPSRDERRQFPRIRVFQELQSRVMPIEDEFRVHDISLGGFAVESPIGFVPGTDHQFEFTMIDGRQAVLHATNVHCLRINRGDQSPTYFAGFAFERVHAEDRQAIEDFVNAVTNAVMP